MDKHEWDSVRNFSMNEAWGDPFKMNACLVHTLDNLRDLIGRPITIHCGYEKRETGGQHPLGNAVDCHCRGVPLMDFFLAASRFPELMGIGMYPLWNNPGLHLDVRNEPMRALWGCAIPGRYVPLNRNFLINVINI